MEVRTQQVIYGVAEVIAAHNLLRYVRKNNNEEKLRMAAGATMAGLGYVFGPELQDRIKHLKDQDITTHFKQNLMYAAGGAVIGSMLGNAVGPKLEEHMLSTRVKETLSLAQTKPEERPSGLLTIASAGWLGYSLFFDGKTKEEQERHLWGLGAGVVGYMYGPEMIHKARDMLVPRQAHDDTLALYARGSTIVGGAAGAALGFFKGADIVRLLSSNGIQGGAR